MATRMVFVDLSEEIQPVYVDGRYEKLLIVVTWGYLPLGLLQLDNQWPHQIDAQRLEAELTNTFGWRLWEMQIAGTLDDLRSEDYEWPPISVVVCTRDRPVGLRRCLAALKQVDYADYEVLVVDNASSQTAVARVVEESGFRYVREDRPGLDWARNRGAAEATNEIIAYIDDDAYAAPGWLRGIAAGFTQPEVMAVTGMVLPAELETAAQHDFEIYGGMNKGFEPYTIDWPLLEGPERFWASRWGVGANMAFRRAVFDEAGYFDTALDVGTPTHGAGDVEFFFRVVSAGLKLRYQPAAIVQHVHRRDSAALEQQIYDNGRSFPAYLISILRHKPELRGSILQFGLRWWLWDWLLKRVWYGLRYRDRKTRRWALTELRGSLTSLGAYRHSRKLAALHDK